MKLIDKYGKSILGYIILILSILNIINHISDLFSFSVLLSLIGILAFILNLLQKRIYITLYFLWIVAQFLIIEVANINTHVVQDIFNLSQNFKLSFGFGLIYKPNSYRLAINFIPFIFLAMYSLIEKNNGFDDKKKIKLSIIENLLIVSSLIVLVTISSIVINRYNNNKSSLDDNKNIIELSDGNSIKPIGFSELVLNGNKKYLVINYYSKNVTESEYCEKCESEALHLIEFLEKENNNFPDTLLMKAHSEKKGFIITKQSRYTTIVYRNNDKWYLKNDK